MVSQLIHNETRISYLGSIKHLSYSIYMLKIYFIYLMPFYKSFRYNSLNITDKQSHDCSDNMSIFSGKTN